MISKNIDKFILGGAGILALDSIITPWFTHGRTLHEICGVESSNIYLDVTEQLTTYLAGVYFLVKYRKNYSVRND